jgi:hypothetical protein
MTSRTGDRGDEMHGQQARIAGRKAQTKRLRRSAIVTSAVALVGASAVVAVLILTTHSSSAPAQSASDMGGMAGMNHGSGQMPANSPSPTMADDMPGMDHGSAGMPVSSPSPTMADDMPGMDHGSGGMPTSSPWPSMADDMPGMDHGHADNKPATSPTPTMADDMPGMDHGSADVHGGGTEHGDAAAVAPDRPVAAVLGTFGGASSAVMLSAVFLRRKDRIRSEAKQAARAARRTQK